MNPSWLKRVLYWLLPDRKKQPALSQSKGKGARKSKRDERDYKAERPGAATYPTKLSNRSFIKRLEVQGAWNSCVPVGETTQVERAAVLAFWDSFELSKMHCWNEARKLSWAGLDAKKNVGVYVRDGLKVLSKGVTLEKLFPYRVEYMNKDLHESWIFRWYPRINYYFLRNLTREQKHDVIRRELYRGNFVGFGIRVDATFEKPIGTRIYPGCDGGEPHYMLIIGYDDEAKTYEIANWWGKSWGDKGYLWVNRDWILDKEFDINYVKAVT